MVQIKLSLKSKRPTTLYSSDGKSYRLLPGSNTLNLEYEDYLALAKTLGLKSVLPPPQASDSSPVVEEPTPSVDEVPEAVEDTPVTEPVVEEAVADKEVAVSEDSSNDNVDVEADSVVTDTLAEDSVVETPVGVEEAVVDKEVAESVEKDEPVNTAVDYASMTYQELREEYKRITGVGRNLKREALIAFLQEHADNV